MTTIDGRFIALETRIDDTWQKSLERLENEWRDRISGGEGGWDEGNVANE